MYHVPNQSGRRIMVTGANSGLGKETARRLAIAGADIVIAARTRKTAEQARDDIHKQAPNSSIEVCDLDLSRSESVKACIAEEIAHDRPLDTLVNNAAVFRAPDRLTTADGLELHWGTNFIGHFALTVGLLPKLLGSPSPRIAQMAAGFMATAKINFKDLNSQRQYSTMAAYSQSKLAIMLMGLRLRDLSQQHGWALLSTLAHPGVTISSKRTLSKAPEERKPFVVSAMLRTPGFPTQDVEHGAGPLLYAAADPNITNGGFYGPSNIGGLTGEPTEVPMVRAAKGPSLAESVWAVAEHTTGMRLPPM